MLFHLLIVFDEPTSQGGMDETFWYSEKVSGRNSDTRGVAEICGGVFDCRRKRRFVEMVSGSVRAKEFLAKYGVNVKDIKTCNIN